MYHEEIHLRAGSIRTRIDLLLRDPLTTYQAVSLATLS